MPPDLLVGEDMVLVNLAAILVDLLAVDAGLAATRLEVQTYAG